MPNKYNGYPKLALDAWPVCFLCFDSRSRGGLGVSGCGNFRGSDAEWGVKMAIARNYIGQEWTPASFLPENDGRSHGDGPKFVANAAVKGWLCSPRVKRVRIGCYERPALLGPVPETINPSQIKASGPLRAAIPFVEEADEARIASDTDFTLIFGV
jgi:hypothetical protein